MQKTILVAEDDHDILLMVSTVLEDAGYTVLTSVGPDTIDAARTNHPDLVLLDNQMPGMDGVTIAQTLHQDPATKDIPIVAMTAATRAPIVCREMDAMGCLGKPFDIDHLIAVLNRLLHTTH
jgi:CheY-like chemotaxis protein